MQVHYVPIDTREQLYAKLMQFSCYIRFQMATN